MCLVWLCVVVCVGAVWFGVVFGVCLFCSGVLCVVVCRLVWICLFCMCFVLKCCRGSCCCLLLLCCGGVFALFCCVVFGFVVCLMCIVLYVVLRALCCCGS